MVISLKVKTLDSQTYDFTVDDEITVRQFKEFIAEKTSLAADQQRIIYCGRVLTDERQLKEYDVNGKVLHLVERPPPSARATATSSDSDLSGMGRRQRDGITVLEGGLRAPVLSALEGMVLGAMTIPVTANGPSSQPTAQPLNPSSTFCMNRITVARHMLDCANNIAAYLENPERGLNNTPLDILTQGRWTLESTVVEVGISAAGNADLPQNQTQNFVEALHGAVSAALRQSGHQNVTVVQLPTVFGGNAGNGGGSMPPPQRLVMREDAVLANSTLPEEPLAQNSDNAGAGTEQMEASTGDQTAENIPPITPAAVETPVLENNVPPQNGTETAQANGSSSRQRTGTRTLAEVVQHMRTVQTRLQPFIEQYYEILQNDPIFEENDRRGRENAQRTFDRVSEALHYMAHAQHAISDLMLDLSQNAPRHLCCRPILVEQSGYVSSNNYLASVLEQQPNGNNPNNSNNNNESTAANQNNQNINSNHQIETSLAGGGQNFQSARFLRPPAPPQVPRVRQRARPQQQETPVVGGDVAGEVSNGQPNATTEPSRNATGPDQAQLQQQGQSQRMSIPNLSNSGLRRILSPLLLPRIHDPRDPSHSAGNAPAAANQILDHNSFASHQEIQPVAELVVNLAPRRILVPTNDQLQVARLIQAVVNSAPVDADVHVQINAPNVLTFGLPIGALPMHAAAQQAAQQQQQQTTATSQTTPQNQASSTTNTASDSNTTSETNQPRVTTATHPTTSTQTRSTPRPQVHVANVVSPWNVRGVIPANMLTSFDRFLPCNSHHISEADEFSRHAANIFSRSRNQMRPRNRQQGTGTAVAVAESSTASTPRTLSASSSRSSPTDDIFNLSTEDFNIPINLFGSNLTLRDLIDISPSPNTLNRIRSELLAFIIANLFSGDPITDENMNEALNQVIQLINRLLIFLPQFDLPDYDARASVENFIRNTLPFIINLVREDDSTEFGTRLLRELISFVRRLLTILVTCVGRSNAEMYLNQVAQMTITSNNATEDAALRILQRHLMAAVIRELDLSRQNTSDVQEFLVIRRHAADIPSPAFEPIEAECSIVTPMETDDEVTGEEKISQNISTERSQNLPSPVEVTPLPIQRQTSDDTNDPLPSVLAGSEAWHNNFPTNWLPIIARDINRQRRQSPQAPYSDAYISGMTSKRRKVVQSSKPPTDVRSLISDGVRTALRQVQSASSSTSTTSATGAANDEIISAISNDPNAESSYHDAFVSHIQERLRTDSDFSPDKYPNSSKYFNKK